MADPIDTARQEGIALGLAMAARWHDEQARFIRVQIAAQQDRLGKHDDLSASMSIVALRNRLPEHVKPSHAILAQAPIPPHVAAARVLLDAIQQAAEDGLDAPIGARFREALELIAKEGE